MRKDKFIELARKSVCVDDEKLSFISTFENPLDAEIVAIITAWLSNGSYNELSTAQDIVAQLTPTPYEFVKSSDALNVFEDVDISINATMTLSHLHWLISKLHEYVTTRQRPIKDIFPLSGALSSKKRHKRPHNYLCALLGGETGFQTKMGGGTFYRYYLLFYWLAYKTTIWQGVDTSMALLPCNSVVFSNAYKLGIFKKPVLFCNIDKAIQLTSIARNWFGDEHFYLMYEYLNSYNA